MIDSIEPLASFIPAPVLSASWKALLIEKSRLISPSQPSYSLTLLRLPKSVDLALPGEEIKIVNSFSRAFAMINAAVEARGGVLKK